MKLSYLVKGFPEHPLHPPLTDVTIGAYTFATIAAVLSKLGVAGHGLASAWWLALLVALCATVLTAATGFADWLEITWGSDLWKTATLHMAANLTAGVVFLVALLTGHDDYVHRSVSSLGLVLTLIGFALLTAGGWLGGKLVFGYGMRVVKPDES